MRPGLAPAGWKYHIRWSDSALGATREIQRGVTGSNVLLLAEPEHGGGAVYPAWRPFQLEEIADRRNLDETTMIEFYGYTDIKFDQRLGDGHFDKSFKDYTFKR